MVHYRNLYLAGMKRKLWFFLSLFLFFAACRQNQDTSTKDNTYLKSAFHKIDSLKKRLHSGDLIFRSGNDEVSRAARSFNRTDTSYSHCGIVLIENNVPYVYHALGGVYNPSQKLMRQTLDSFANPTENNAIGAWRYPLDSIQIHRLTNVVQQYYNIGIKFDLFFNFKSDDRMYCAEFVYKSLNNATNGNLVPYVNMDTLPFGVTTDDLFLYKKAMIVSKENFNK